MSRESFDNALRDLVAAAIAERDWFCVHIVTRYLQRAIGRNAMQQLVTSAIGQVPYEALR